MWVGVEAIYVYLELIVVFDCFIESSNSVVITAHSQSSHHGDKLLIALSMVTALRGDHSIIIYRITRMFCEHQTFANFARVHQFATIKSAKP